MSDHPCQLDDIRAARERICAYARVTPVLTCATLDRLAGKSLHFKCEHFQRGGSFKIRGACNAVMQLTDEAAARGVVTHSSGNFAQALAIAAGIRGIEAHIVMPETAPAVKRRAVEGYGATVYPCPPTLIAREAGAAAIIERTGATMIHPFDHPHIIAGQGTIGLELMEQVEGGFDAVVAPIGGGGLISGIALAMQRAAPRVRVIAGEPAGADDAARSKAENRLIPQTAPNTIADGLLTSMGKYTWPVVRDLVERVVTVTDEQIIAAMRLIWERMKVVVEPSGAVPLAVVLSDEFKALPDIHRVAIVLSGGNVDLDRLRW